MEAIRSELCAQARIAEELVPLHVLQTFYVVHEAHAQRALRYADATVLRDALPPRVVEAYRVAWGGAVIPLKLVYGSRSDASRSVCAPRAGSPAASYLASRSSSR